MLGEGKPDSWLQPWLHPASPDGFPSDQDQACCISWVLQFLLPLSSSCPSLFKLVAGVGSPSVHWQGCRERGGHRKGSSRCAYHILVEETHQKWNHFRFGNRVAAVILKSVSGFMVEDCNKLFPGGSWEPVQQSELILARTHFQFPHNISRVNESKWEKVWILWTRS